MIFKNFLRITAILLSICSWIPSAQADSFDIIRGGKSYRCNEVAGNCWKNCRKENSFNSCKNHCDTRQNDCWDACRSDNNSFNSCKNYCDTSTPGCWDACTSDNNSFESCKNYCSSNSPFNELMSQALTLKK